MKRNLYPSKPSVSKWKKTSFFNTKLILWFSHFH
jgi:hypothetical protein